MSSLHTGSLFSRLPHDKNDVSIYSFLHGEHVSEPSPSSAMDTVSGKCQHPFCHVSQAKVCEGGSGSVYVMRVCCVCGGGGGGGSHWISPPSPGGIRSDMSHKDSVYKSEMNLTAPCTSNMAERANPMHRAVIPACSLCVKLFWW